MDQQLKIALPKGRFLTETASLLQKADWGLGAYHEGMRSYRLKSKRFPGFLIKVFHEKDIPIQVAVGNYDLGICGSDWIEELLVKYPSSALVKLRNLGYGEGRLWIVASRSLAGAGIERVQAKREAVRMASEYPNLAESFALEQRLRRFSVFPLWGAAEAYPPESAELALVAGGINQDAFNHNLAPMSNVLTFSACLIANKSSWENKDLSPVLDSIDSKSPQPEPLAAVSVKVTGIPEEHQVKDVKKNIRLALPDGHQQQPTLELLNKAGIRINDYPSSSGNRRPDISLSGVTVKVIRPQDMPLQVASGNFDLAITGRDWLLEHLYQFPSSPVKELVDLKFGRVKLVAVVVKDLPVADAYGLKQYYSGRLTPIRVASEYVNIADKYAQDNHLGAYRVIPTWGATEAFLPEDADLLIENTQTGRTIAQHNLKIIDNLFESTACLIGNKESISQPDKKARIASIVKTFRTALEVNN